MKETWTKAISNENGRLAHGSKHNVEFQEVPRDLDMTYDSFHFDYRLLKTENYRAWIVVGGDRLSYKHSLKEMLPIYGMGNDDDIVDLRLCIALYRMLINVKNG